MNVTYKYIGEDEITREVTYLINQTCFPFTHDEITVKNGAEIYEGYVIGRKWQIDSAGTVEVKVYFQ